MEFHVWIACNKHFALVCSADEVDLIRPARLPFAVVCSADKGALFRLAFLLFAVVCSGRGSMN